MKLEDLQAFPCAEDSECGLNVRQHFASMAMAAMIGSGDYASFKKKNLAQQAVEFADALIEELE